MIPNQLQIYCLKLAVKRISCKCQAIVFYNSFQCCLYLGANGAAAAGAQMRDFQALSKFDHLF